MRYAEDLIASSAELALLEADGISTRPWEDVAVKDLPDACFLIPKDRRLPVYEEHGGKRGLLNRNGVIHAIASLTEEDGAGRRRELHALARRVHLGRFSSYEDGPLATKTWIPELLIEADAEEAAESDQSMEEVLNAIKEQARESLKTLDLFKEPDGKGGLLAVGGPQVLSVFPTGTSAHPDPHVIAKDWQTKEVYRVPYDGEGDDLSFNKPIPVVARWVDKGASAEAETPAASQTTEEAPTNPDPIERVLQEASASGDAADLLLEEASSTLPFLEEDAESGEFRFAGRILLEEGTTKATQTTRPYARYKFPVLDPHQPGGKGTRKGNRYFEESGDWLVKDTNRLLESTRGRGTVLEVRGRREIFGAMYPTHDPANPQRSAGHNRLLSISGRLRGVSKDEAGLFWVHGETLPTQAGQDMAVLLTETDFCPYVSLRAEAKEGKDQDGKPWAAPNELGGADVRRMILLGADHTENPSMFGLGASARVLLEEVAQMPRKLSKRATELIAGMDEDTRTALMEELGSDEAGDKETPTPKATAKAAEAGGISEERIAEIAAGAVMAALDAREEKAKGEADADAAKADKEEVEELRAALDDTEIEKRTDTFLKNLGMGEKAGAELKAAVFPKVKAALADSKAKPGSDERKKEVATAVREEATKEATRIKELLLEGGVTPDRHPMIANLDRLQRGGASLTEEDDGPASPNLNLLDGDLRKWGQLAEEIGHEVHDRDAAGAPTIKLSDAILAHMPQFRNGGLYRNVGGERRYIFEEWDKILKPVMKAQAKHLKRGQDALVNPGSPMSFLATMGRELLMEAGEQTTAYTLASKPEEIAEAIIKAKLPNLIALQTARTGVMNAPTKRYFERTYRRFDDAIVGTLTAGAGWSDAADEGARSQPGRLYIKCTVAPSTSGTSTVTFTNQLGNAATATATIAGTESVGAYVEIVPAVAGDIGTDVTAGTDAGANTGTWQFVIGIGAMLASAEAPSTFPKARTQLAAIDATAASYEIGAALSHDTIEDMNAAIQDVGGGFDVLGDLIEYLAFDIQNEIDQIYLDTVASNATGAALTFNQSTVPQGKKPDEWNQELSLYLARAKSLINWESNVEADWAVLNTVDEPYISWWLKDLITAFKVQAGDAFQNVRPVGRLHGLRLFVSSNQKKGKITIGSSMAGVWYLIYVALQLLGPQWDPSTNANAVLRRHRAAMKVTQPKTLATVTIN